MCYLGVVASDVGEQLVDEASNQGAGRVDAGDQLRDDLRRHKRSQTHWGPLGWTMGGPGRFYFEISLNKQFSNKFRSLFLRDA